MYATGVQKSPSSLIIIINFVFRSRSGLRVIWDAAIRHLLTIIGLLGKPIIVIASLASVLE